MIFNRDRVSSSIPRWTFAVLVGSILASVVVDLVLATFEYRSFEAYYRTTELNASAVLGPLSDHLWWAMQQTWFPAGLIILGFVLARRGRRWLFAGPTLAFFITPVLVAVSRGTPAAAFPGLAGGFSRLAWEYGVWVTWVVSGVRLLLYLVPGFLVARHVEQERNHFRVPALAMVAIPAIVAGYLGVLVVSPTGRIQDSPVDLFVAVFFFGAAMGFDRPLWPWLVVAVPGVLEGLPAMVLAGQANEVLLVVFIAVLGASSVPFSRILLRGWQENISPGSQPEAGAVAG